MLMVNGYLTHDEVRVLLGKRAAVEGLNTAARAVKISPAMLCNVIHGKRQIGRRLATAFGFKRHVLFTKA